MTRADAQRWERKVRFRLDNAGVNPWGLPAGTLAALRADGLDTEAATIVVLHQEGIIQ